MDTYLSSDKKQYEISLLGDQIKKDNSRQLYSQAFEIKQGMVISNGLLVMSNMLQQKWFLNESQIGQVFKKLGLLALELAIENNKIDKEVSVIGNGYPVERDMQEQGKLLESELLRIVDINKK